MSIVMVDDNDDCRFVLKKLIQKVCPSESVLEFSDGQSGFEYISNHPDIKLIISDIKMPKMDGIQLASELRSSGITIPIVLITAHQHIDVTSKDDYQVDDILPKPFGLQEIKELCSKFILEVV